MRLRLSGFLDELQAIYIIRTFYSSAEAVTENEELFLSCEEMVCGYTITASSEAFGEISVKERLDGGEDAAKKRILRCQCRGLYNALSYLTGLKPPWGILTGVRPGKMVLSMLSEGMGEEEIAEILRREYLLTGESIKKLFTIVEIERKFLENYPNKGIMLYISIPFCPTRCHYCSFVSHSIEKGKKLLEPYLELLKKEIELTGEIIKEAKLLVKAIYIGGGTPTVLGTNQLSDLLETVEKHIPYEKDIEYTCEAGRPDTLSAEKFKVLFEKGINRISINPQSMKDETLHEIGRRHSARDVSKAFFEARQAGFLNINMDLIAGLPGEDLDDFEYSVAEILKLSPESVTVHSLSYKKGSFLSGGAREDDALRIASKMTCLSGEVLTREKYLPYYIYRQKNTAGGLENIGYAKEGRACIYNIVMMEEAADVLSVGAGGITKLIRGEGRIIRIANTKYPYEYISDFGKVIESKKHIKTCYSKER